MKPTLEQLTAEFATIGVEPPPPPPPPAAAPKPASAATAASSGPAVATAVAAPKPATPATPPVAPKPTTDTKPAAAPGAAPAAVATPKPVTPAAPVAPATPPTPAPKGYDFDVSVAAKDVVAAAAILDRHGFAIDAVTGVDWPVQGQMEVVYDYFHPTAPVRAVVRTRVPRSEPELPTISTIFPGANWHERETHDFFGIRFAGHPNLKPFLLPDDADFHPLRKDYNP